MYGIYKPEMFRLALSENGTLATIAAKYGLTNDLIANIGSDK